MRPLVIPAVLAASCLLAGCLRSDAPPPVVIEPAPAASAAAKTGKATPVRLGTGAATDLLRLEVLHYTATGEVRRDDAQRWSDAPAAILRRRLESSAAACGVALQDRSDLPLLEVVVERFGIAGSDTLQLVATAHLRCRLADGTIRIAAIDAAQPLAAASTGDLATAAGALLDQLAIKIWQQAR